MYVISDSVTLLEYTFSSCVVYVCAFGIHVLILWCVWLRFWNVHCGAGPRAGLQAIYTHVPRVDMRGVDDQIFIPMIFCREIGSTHQFFGFLLAFF